MNTIFFISNHLKLILFITLVSIISKMDIIKFLEENMLSCSWKQNLGVDCMGCGMQRSIVFLLKGEFVEAFKMYPAIYTLIAMFLFLGIHLIYDFKKGGKILTYLFIINAIIILTNFILKITN